MGRDGICDLGGCGWVVHELEGGKKWGYAVGMALDDDNDERRRDFARRRRLYAEQGPGTQSREMGVGS